MTRNIGLAATLAALALACGCFSFNWAHNKRHVKVVWDELVDLHQDIDKTIFGLDRYPAER
ncbi:MAG: hypothetical protein HY722_06480 [Planctomycetes bacterium]|nr:hypothetical protein [Planctomycetota bacterium]